jgi:alkanesulfonate monooxygenase SsuD/methylene tetrahydromethanopterin reductase-like flavin-dependent oxidoreductase (luciferase family)
MVRFLRKALRNEKVDEEFETFRVRGFRLGRPLESPPPILIAALREGMLRLAGREGDGAILNWLSADDVPRVARYVHEGGAGKEIAARIFVCPTPDPELARGIGRRAIAAYLNVPVYAAFHEWLGREPLLGGMWDAWRAGDRKGALDAIPDRVVDDLIVHGTPEACREHIQRYVENGVTTPALALMFPGVDVRQTLRDLAPA